MKPTLLSFAKLLFAAAALLGGTLAARAEATMGVIVVKADGSSYEIELPQVARISFGATEVSVENTSGQKAEFAYADVDRILLNSPLSGIEAITAGGNIAVWPTVVESTVNISGADPGTDVRVYTLGGSLAATGRCTEGTLCLDLSAVPAGMCIVAVGNHSVKIIKK